MKGQNSLEPLVSRFFENDPVGASHFLETMPVEEIVQVIQSLPVSIASETINRFNLVLTADVLQKIPGGLFNKIIPHIEGQHMSNVFMKLSPETRIKLLELLPENKKKRLKEFLTYPEDSAGRLMTFDFIAFHSDIRVKEAIQTIRYFTQQGVRSSYLYVIDKENRLTGVLRIRDMLLAEGNEILDSIMQKDVFRVNCFTDREQLASELSKRSFFAVPVVDTEDRLIGIIRVSQLLGGIQQGATEDLQKMFGASGDENVFSPVSFSLKTRLPWLHFNLVTAFLAAGVVSLFQGIIDKITVLAVFLPVVAGQGGNAGAQSMAVVMRGLVMREIPVHKAKNLILKETIVGAVNGIIIGIVTAIIAWLWEGNPFLGLAVGLGMLVNLTVAGLSGAVIPISMKALGLDPAQCSSIILTTITDVVGFFSYLGFAVLFQKHLL